MYGILFDNVIAKTSDHADVKHEKQEITVTIFLDVTQDYIYVRQYFFFYSPTKNRGKASPVNVTSSDGEIQ